ncbi:putative calcium-binding protein CML31 [Cocos nucifera]|uniref:Putative calcium-binding protein CML31 n=1 Tax=Cocos nucifera TaxID=13894 RepID=A0A8K0IQB3_COCNU|nr:putative calcium-binding protein CML31 [Cocos nucifera]
MCWALLVVVDNLPDGKVMPEKFLFGRRPLVPLCGKDIKIIIGEPIEFDLQSLKQTAKTVSRESSIPSLGWPNAIPDGLDEAAQKWLYINISDQIRTVMERLRNFGVTLKRFKIQLSTVCFTMMLTVTKEAIPRSPSGLSAPLDEQNKNPPSIIGKLRVMLSPKKSEKNPTTLLRVPTGSNLSRLSTSSSITSGRREMERVFRYFDENGDGKISPAELRSRMRTAGEELSPEDAEAVVASSDSDGDGLLCYDDFVRLVDVEGEEEKARSLREAFGVYEMEGRGCITPKSLQQALRKLGESRTNKECAAMIRRFDLNGDGVLSFDEFRIMML